jgi:hypothetical protein
MPCSLPFKDLGKIGKLRLMKSGKVILRVGNAEKYIDMEVSKGIETTFYQELAKISEGKIQFVSPIKQKLVVTPELI